MNQQTETKNSQAAPTPPASTQTDNLARIAAALERIADKQDYLASCADDSIDLLKELNQEFSSFSRHGFGM
ncbi:hypothetical protein EBX31_04210 [bacterium]|nr:hypothetical protein [bacterium]